MTCYACLADLQPNAVDDGEAAGVSVVVRCPECRQLFCFDCDAFIHETLHNCPGACAQQEMKVQKMLSMHMPWMKVETMNNG